MVTSPEKQRTIQLERVDGHKPIPFWKAVPNSKDFDAGESKCIGVLFCEFSNANG